MNTAKSVLRSAKNFTFGFTDMQIKTREATSNDPGGPTTHAMNEIASATFDELKFREVMSILRKRLNDHGKNWRHVYKSLLIIDYCIQFGSERVIDYALTNIQLIKTLKEFQYTDTQGRDHGAAVRQKSRELTALLLDMDQLNAVAGANRDNGRFNRQRNSDTWSNGGGGGLRRSISSLSLNAQQRRTSSSPAVNGGLSEAEALKVALEASRADILASQQKPNAGANVGKLVDLMGEDSEDEESAGEKFYGMSGQFSNGNMGSSQSGLPQLNNCNPAYPQLTAPQYSQLNNSPYPPLSNGQAFNSPYPQQLYAPQYPQLNNSGHYPQSSAQFSHPCNLPQQFTPGYPGHNSLYSQPQAFSQPQLPQQFYGQSQSFESVNASSSALFPPLPLATDPFQTANVPSMNPFVAGPDAGPQEKQLVDLRPSSLLTNPFGAVGNGGIQESGSGKSSREYFQ